MTLLNLASTPQLVRWGLLAEGGGYMSVHCVNVTHEGARPEHQVQPHRIAFRMDDAGNCLARVKGIVGGRASFSNGAHLSDGQVDRWGDLRFLTLWEKLGTWGKAYDRFPINAEHTRDGLVLTAPKADFISGERVIIAGPFHMKLDVGDVPHLKTSSAFYYPHTLLTLGKRPQTVNIMEGPENVDTYPGGLYQLVDDILFILDLLLSDNPARGFSDLARCVDREDMALYSVLSGFAGLLNRIQDEHASDFSDGWEKWYKRMCLFYLIDHFPFYLPSLMRAMMKCPAPHDTDALISERLTSRGLDLERPELFLPSTMRRGSIRMISPDGPQTGFVSDDAFAQTLFEAMAGSPGYNISHHLYHKLPF